MLLASGGFQGDKELVKRFLGWDADRILAALQHRQRRRRLPARAGRGRGGQQRPRHVLRPHRRLAADAFEPESYLPLAQYHSKWCILVNRLGRRYHDEALGDEVANQLTLRQPGARGVLLCDERVRRERVVGAPYPHGQVIDRFEHARASARGSRRRRRVEALVAQRGGVGRRHRGARRDTLDAYEHGGPQDAPITAPVPLREPPFWAVEFQPTITFSLGGVRVDSWGRVLDRDGAAVRGLYCAGRRRGRTAGPALRGRV